LGSGLGASAGPPAVKAQLLPTGLQSKTEGRKRRLQNLRFPIDQPQEFRIDGEAFSLGGSPVEPEGPLGQVLEPVRPQGERTPAIAQRDVAQGMTETPVRCEGAWQRSEARRVGREGRCEGWASAAAPAAAAREDHQGRSRTA